MNHNAILDSFLTSHPMPGAVLSAAIGGSIGYNLALPGSDTDILGVFAVPTNVYLSLADTPKHVKFERNQGQTKIDCPDHQFYEVRRFCELLMKGTPTAIELLYAKHDLTNGSDVWDRLLAVRHRFLSCACVNQYVGFLTHQSRKFLSAEGKVGNWTGTYNEKWAYHIVRMAGDARQIIDGNEPIVWKTDAERDVLLNVRMQAYDWPSLCFLIEERMSLLAAEPQGLPRSGSLDLLNGWLLTVRASH